MTNILTPENFGAIGNGIADDSNAIYNLCKTVSSTLNACTPSVVTNVKIVLSGTYRIGRYTANAGCATSPYGLGFGLEGAMHFESVSNLVIEFVNGAKILMDNLSNINIGDQAHGIVFKGKGENIKLTNPKVEWKTKASSRSQGDGIRFLGYPDDSITIKNIEIINSQVINAPQAGMIFMGCRDIYVSKHNAYNCLADGLHFNACKNIIVDYTSNFNDLFTEGDDTCAFVTYLTYYGSPAFPYTINGLTDWCNSNAVVGTINSNGGAANGLRIAQGKDITVENVIVRGKKPRAVVIDSINGFSTDATPPKKYPQTYLASENCTIQNIFADECGEAINIQHINNTSNTTWNTIYQDFDINIGTVNVKHTLKTYPTGTTKFDNSLYMLNASGLKLINLYSENVQFLIQGISNVKIENLNIVNSPSNNIIEGYLPFLLNNSNANVNDYYNDSVKYNNDIFISNIKIQNGETFLINKLKPFKINSIFIENVKNQGLEIQDCVNGTIDNLRIHYPNRNNNLSTTDISVRRGLLILKGNNLIIGRYDLIQDGNNIGSSIEIGGNDANFASKNILIRDFIYILQQNNTNNGIVTQGGTYATTNYFISGKFYNSGTPNWINI